MQQVQKIFYLGNICYFTAKTKGKMMFWNKILSCAHFAICL